MYYAGLASKAHRKFNDTNERKFITTQSVKQLKEELKEWAFDKNGWKLTNLPNKVIDITKLYENESLATNGKMQYFIKKNGLKIVMDLNKD